MYVSVVDRRDYWVAHYAKPGETVELKYVGNSIVVIKAQLATQGELMQLSESEVVAWVAERKRDSDMQILDSEMSPQMLECSARLALGENLSDLRIEFKSDENIPLDLETWIEARKTLRN